MRLSLKIYKGFLMCKEGAIYKHGTHYGWYDNVILSPLVLP
jgi:hypothetical protein